MKTPKRSFPRVGGSAWHDDLYVPGDEPEPSDKDIELFIKDELSTDHEIVQQLVSENDETASLLGAVLREDMESKSDAWKARRLEEIVAMLYSDAAELAEQEMTEGVA